MLAFSRYRFDFQVDTPLQVNFYSGSMLRGAFGHALKRTVCVTRDTACPSCLLYRSCVYTVVLETLPREHSLQNFSQISSPYFQVLGRQAESIECDLSVHWYDWQRYSHRQQQSMALGRMLGRIAGLFNARDSVRVEVSKHERNP